MPSYDDKYDEIANALKDRKYKRRKASKKGGAYEEYEAEDIGKITKYQLNKLGLQPGESKEKVKKEKRKKEKKLNKTLKQKKTKKEK